MMSLRDIVNQYVIKKKNKIINSIDTKTKEQEEYVYNKVSEAISGLRFEIMFDETIEEIQSVHERQCLFYKDKLELLENRLKALKEYKKDK